MRITIERLIDGDARVAPALAAAASKWRGLIERAQRDQAFDLSAEARDQQYAFEQASGDRLLGKAAMGMTAAVELAATLAVIYDRGEREVFARRVVAAIAGCSSEVKLAFYDAARLYDIDTGGWRP